MKFDAEELLYKSRRAGFGVVIFGFIGFFIWAATYSLNQGVPGSGFLISKNERFMVLAPVTGMISKIPKKAGDHVEVNELLIELDSTTQLTNEKSMRESIRGLELSNATLSASLISKNMQVTALKSQFSTSQSLVEAGFASPNSLAVIQAQLSLAESEFLELKAKFEQDKHRLLELNERILGLRHEISLQKLVSPVKGRIMNVAIKSAGINVTAGTQIMEIVPDSDQLIVDIRIPIEHATRVQEGAEVDVMFPTLPGNSTLRLKGTLDYISADRLVDAKSNQAYLEGRVSLRDQIKVGAIDLRAGLPATVMIKTGPRTMLSYITRPFLERINRGLQ